MPKYINLDTVKLFLDKKNNALEALPLLVEIAETNPEYFADDFIIEVAQPHNKEKGQE